MAGRLLAISDLHIGYPENRDFALSLRPADPGDWLIVAGDVGEVFADVGYVLATLADRFARVIWTPGNHELWTLPADPVAVRGVARYEALLKVCRRFGAPVLPRGAGTSLAGQCCNVAVVLDFTKYMNRILELDAGARFARVQPGVVLDTLRAEAERHQLTFGPDP